MSRYGKRSSWKPAWKCRPLGPGTRDEIADLEAEAKRWELLAPVFGFCSHCGARVDEANGKLHDEGCLPGQPERCQKGQRS